MYIKFIILSIFILVFDSVKSQDKEEIRVVLNTQAEVDNFPKAFQNTDNITSLYIRSNKDNPIYNLDSLYSLKNIDVFLSIRTNYQLESISGLQNLKTVGSLEFVNNDKVLYLSALESLSRIRNKVKIAGNKNLKSIDILDTIDLDSIISFNCSGNENIFELSIRKKMKNVKYLTIEGNNNLERISNLSTNISLEYLNISANKKLKVIDFLPKVKSLKRLIILYNLNLEQLKFSDLEEIVEEIDIMGNMKLQKAIFLKNIKFGSKLNVRIISNTNIQSDDLSNLCLLKSNFPDRVIMKENSKDCQSD